MARRRAVLAALCLLAVGACDPAPKAPPPPPKSVAVAPPAPARTGRMICRDSQTGKTAECGAPNAVMVGLVYDPEPSAKK